MEDSEFQYDIITCQKCGTANVRGQERCRRCRTPLKVRNPLTLPLAVGGGLILIILCSGMAIAVARTTPLGVPLALVMFIFSGILSFIGGIWLLIEGFRAGPLWGFGLLLFGPIVSFVFLFAKPDYALKPWVVSFLGIICFIVGVLMIPDSFLNILNQVSGAGF